MPSVTRTSPHPAMDTSLVLFKCHSSFKRKPTHERAWQRHKCVKTFSKKCLPTEPSTSLPFPWTRTTPRVSIDYMASFQRGRESFGCPLPLYLILIEKMTFAHTHQNALRRSVILTMGKEQPQDLLKQQHAEEPLKNGVEQHPIDDVVNVCQVTRPHSSVALGLDELCVNEKNTGYIRALTCRMS